MMANRKVIPSRRVLGQLARATLDNATGLVEDARVLEANRRRERAFAIAILAMEEFGKHLSCVGAATLGGDETSEVYWARFWKNFTSHEAKYGVGLAALAGALPIEMSKTIVDQFSSDVSTDQDWKFRALYVDFQNNTLLLPSDIPPESSAAAVRRVTDVVGTWADHWAGVDLEELFDRGIVHAHPAIGEAMASADFKELARLILTERSPPPIEE